MSWSEGNIHYAKKHCPLHLTPIETVLKNNVLVQKAIKWQSWNSNLNTAILYYPGLQATC